MASVPIPPSIRYTDIVTMVECYMTVEGRSADTHAAIAASPFELGFRSSQEYLERYSVEFVDFPFTNPRFTFDLHALTVRREQPTLTVAPDIEKGRDPETVFAQADELLESADHVVVVPKDIHPREVPARFRCGVPLADYGTGAKWTTWDYLEHDGEKHLLGGGPSRQLSVKGHLNIASLDTATLGKRARFGIWTQEGGYVDADTEASFRERLERSLTEYYHAWND